MLLLRQRYLTADHISLALQLSSDDLTSHNHCLAQAVRILGYLTSAISGLIGLLLLSALNSWECEELHDIEQCQNVKYL